MCTAGIGVRSTNFQRNTVQSDCVGQAGAGSLTDIESCGGTVGFARRALKAVECSRRSISTTSFP